MYCNKCHQDKLPDFFSTLKTGKKRVTCKDCRRALSRQWYGKRVGEKYNPFEGRRVNLPPDSQEYNQEIQRRKAAKEGRPYRTHQEIAKAAEEKKRNLPPKPINQCIVCGIIISRGGKGGRKYCAECLTREALKRAALRVYNKYQKILLIV